MQKRAPIFSRPQDSGVKSARSSGVALVDLASFQLINPKQFFHYKDLQSDRIFGPAMAFRVTRTPGWLTPAIANGQPKYLPEDIVSTLNRLRRGESPDAFHNCLGRGEPRNHHAAPSAKPKPAALPPTPKHTQPPVMALTPLIAHEASHRGKKCMRIFITKEWAPVLKCKVNHRRYFPDTAATDKFIAEAQQRLADFSKGNGTFTDQELTTFRYVLQLVDGDVTRIIKAVQNYKEPDASDPAKQPRLVKVVARHYLLTRNLYGVLRDSTLATVRCEIRKFAKKFGERYIGEITRKEIQNWVSGLKLQAKGKKNVMGSVKLLFDHAVELELREDNPAIGIKLPKISQAAPERFTVAECERMLFAGVRDKLPFLLPLVVGLFSGARPGETRRTSQQDMSLAEERINIPGANSKTHQFRWVRITPLLKQWLEFIGKKGNGRLVPGGNRDTYEAWRQELAEAAGLKDAWKYDGLRHTNASFDYALRGDFHAVAANLGNAPAISRKHYIAPATEAEARQFLALTPEHILALIAKENGNGSCAAAPAQP